jgi:hypothetical protein
VRNRKAEHKTTTARWYHRACTRGRWEPKVLTRGGAARPDIGTTTAVVRWTRRCHMAVGAKVLVKAKGSPAYHLAQGARDHGQHAWLKLIWFEPKKIQFQQCLCIISKQINKKVLTIHFLCTQQVLIDSNRSTTINACVPHWLHIQHEKETKI